MSCLDGFWIFFGWFVQCSIGGKAELVQPGAPCKQQRDTHMQAMRPKGIAMLSPRVASMRVF
eukprot:2679773-Amphidinium_carterae.13